MPQGNDGTGNNESDSNRPVTANEFIEGELDKGLQRIGQVFGCHAATLSKTRRIQVTQKMKKERAKKIGEELNNTKRWHSHGYGISIEVLTKELNLLIDDYGAIQERSDAIRAYHDLLDDYMSKRNDRGVIHVCGHYRSYM